MRKQNPNAAIEKRRVDLALKIIRLEHKIPEQEVRKLKDEYATLFVPRANAPFKKKFYPRRDNGRSNFQSR